MADWAHNHYVRAIKRLTKGGKKAEVARDELIAHLPENPAALWPDTWATFLGRLQKAADKNPSLAAEVFAAYSAAHADARRTWERWLVEFRAFRSQLRGWLEEVGIRPVPLDLSAKDPAAEIARAVKEFAYDEPDQKSPAWWRAELALLLDPTLKYDVEWGSLFERPVPDLATRWPVPWVFKWPMAFPDQYLLNVVFRLVIGADDGSADAGTIQDWMKHWEEFASDMLNSKGRHSLLILRPNDLLVMVWVQTTGVNPTGKTWEHVEVLPYDAVEIREPSGLRKGRIDITLPTRVGDLTLKGPTDRGLTALVAAKRGAAAG